MTAPKSHGFSRTLLAWSPYLLLVAFVLVWLLSFYVIIGLVETIIAVPREHVRKKRDLAAQALAAQALAARTERTSAPPK